MAVLRQLCLRLTAVSCWPSSRDRKSTRLNSSHGYISYAVFCLKKKKTPSLTPLHFGTLYVCAHIAHNRPQPRTNPPHTHTAPLRPFLSSSYSCSVTRIFLPYL